jgi:DNA-binding NarL/FixJ family response regulator
MDVAVALVDDGSVAFRGVAGVLQEIHRKGFLGCFTSVAQLSSVVASHRRVVIVADPCTAAPGTLTGLPAHVALLVMTGSNRTADVRRAVQAGARGYIGKGTDVTTLRGAIAAVAAGDLYFDGDLSDMLLRDTEGELGGAGNKPHHLTPRECDVLVLVAQGLTHKQIGTRLGLSKATVDTYVHRVRQKVGSVNKAGLTRVAIALELMPDSA